MEESNVVMLTPIDMRLLLEVVQDNNKDGILDKLLEKLYLIAELEEEIK